jgi:hypothetical protein
MATTRQSVSQEVLKRRWQERCQQGTFSAGVLGMGTIRVFGRAGDAPVAFPRIESLAGLDALEADERWAFETAQGIVQAAQTQNRPVMATQPPHAGAIPNPTPLKTFDPSAENILILSLTRCG